MIHQKNNNQVIPNCWQGRFKQLKAATFSRVDITATSVLCFCELIVFFSLSFYITKLITSLQLNYKDTLDLVSRETS